MHKRESKPECDDVREGLGRGSSSKEEYSAPRFSKARDTGKVFESGAKALA